MGAAGNDGLQLLLEHFSNATPSCGFYYYLVLSILIMLSLVLFTSIVEEHYERYLDQEEELHERSC